MKVLVGGRELITTAVLQVPEGEDAWVEFKVNQWDVRVNVRFIDSTQDTEQAVNLEGKGDHAVLVLKNWNYTLPAALPEPMAFGETDGRKVVLALSGYAIQGFKRIDLSFFLEKANG
jgi:hypothetical protein